MEAIMVFTIPGRPNLELRCDPDSVPVTLNTILGKSIWELESITIRPVKGTNE
jgi:hypothetical protein|tara:strand:- start:846 stop:1004 length:159 start_codon:yes stop_codon:yes gene_type:complete